MEALTTPEPLDDADRPEYDISVVLPCLNEAASVAACVTQAEAAMLAAGLVGEVIVVDNGSTDGSAALAHAAGARIVRETRRGYGSAYLAGFAAASGRYVVMADADGTYDLSEIPRFAEELDRGADLVIGSRLRGAIEPGAMPWLHRHVGNPLLTGLLNVFARTSVSDAHCGMRAFRRDLLPRLDLQATGMELASEHLIRSAALGLEIREVPIAYGARQGTSKLETLPDGWRHLRLLLVHNPTWLFLLPGAVLLAVGAATALLGLTSVLEESGQIFALVIAAVALIVGCQLVQFGVFARSFAVWQLGARDPLFERARERISLEAVLICGALVALAGFVPLALVGAEITFGDFEGLGDYKLAIIGLVAFVIGVQVVFASFLLSILGLRRRRSDALTVPEVADAPSDTRQPLSLH